MIEDLEDKIEQLEARLRALSGAPIHDTTEGSVTLELVGGSRPPSSLHSVPQERASSRVVSLCGGGGGGGAHDRYVSRSTGLSYVTQEVHRLNMRNSVTLLSNLAQ